MNDTTNQMSLLDAIGFAAPEAPAARKKDKPAKRRAKDAPAPAEAPVSSVPENMPVAETAAPPEDAALAARAETPAPDLSEDADDPALAGAADTAETQVALAEPDAGDGRLPLDRFLCFALYSANHAMHGVYKALLKDVGLTYPQFLAMTVLWDNNNVPVGTITQKLQLDTNTLTPLLKRLEAMGLVTRTRNPKDERQVILKLTRKGRALQKKTEHFGACILSSTGLSVEDVMDIQEKIMRLRDNLRDAGTES